MGYPEGELKFRLFLSGRQNEKKEGTVNDKNDNCFLIKNDFRAK